MVPCKPHPIGNKYHTIACKLSRILLGKEIMEGNNKLNKIPFEPRVSHGKTVGSLMIMCESLFHTGKVVVLDSCFCVLCGLVKLAKKGIFAVDVIKK